MNYVLFCRDFIFNNKSQDLVLVTINKLTGWIGCASFLTNGEDKIKVFEGDGSGSDDAVYTFEEFIDKYNFVLKNEGE